MSSFANFKLSPVILNALEIKGYTKPTPIQEMSIPHLLEGGDMLGIAQTGTGKTAAFSLPIINNLSRSNNKVRPKQARCLILTPTRELASQIEENVKLYGKGLGLSSVVIFGGVNPRPQIKALGRGVDIIIATPGRLLDLMSSKFIGFEQLETLILDEADRMLDMGFIRDINKIIARIPKKRQTLLFSATMPQDIATLSQKLLVNPKRVEVSPESTTVEKIDQKINFVEKNNKLSLLKNIINEESIEHALVFTNTKHGANKVVKFLVNENIMAAAIHGNKSQGAREKALGGFKNGRIKILVATDIAARGIDVSHISHVINFHLPNDPTNYVHRIGRTARAGREGVSISFCDTAEKPLLKSIQKCINYNIPVDEDYSSQNLRPEKREKRIPGAVPASRPNRNRRRRATR